VTLSPRVRKLALTAHVAASVGWLGAVTVALILAIAGLASRDPATVRAAYLALELIAWFVLVPLAFASLVTGLVQSLGTAWGLFRHYWVLAKLLINIFATIVLLLYMPTLGHLADIAAETTVPRNGLEELGDPSPALHAGAALLLLVTATVLGVYKPRGLTPYGWRKQHERRGIAAP
jgi:hypothetical protein